MSASPDPVPSGLLAAEGSAPPLRVCRRMGCRWPASATLSFQYATRRVWLHDLAMEEDPAAYDLCPDHADSLTVPRGWERLDRRSSRPIPAEPPPRVVPRPRLPDGANRYAGLAEALPAIAREAAGPIGDQLAIPVEELADPPAVVVSLQRASRRPATR